MRSPSTVDTGGRLVGRDAALAATGAALADAVAGVGGLLLVAGEPGIGKSALLAEQSRRATVRVLHGAGWEGAPSFWLWTQVLRGLGAAGIFDRASAGGAEARFRLFDAVGVALAEAAPLLVVLDDLHWADDDSLRLLDFLRRSLVTAPILFLGAYRDGEAGPVLRTLVGSAPGVPLAGLDTAGVAALMAAVAGPGPDAELADAVRRRCGGNPFFVRELTRLMVARGKWGTAAVSVPDEVRDTLRMRLARLSQPCADLLGVVAVAGSEARLDLLARIGPDDVPELLGEAERARILIAEPAGWSFAHDLYRETVLAQIPPARRAKLHAAVGRGLLALSADGADTAAVGGAARLAAHFVAAGSAAEALHWSVVAAQEATARLGHEEAARHYETALTYAEADRVALLLGLAGAHDRAGDAQAAREAYLRAAELARTVPDVDALAEAALGVAGLGARAGSVDPVSIGLLEEADRLLAAGALRARVLAELARARRHATPEFVDPRASSAAQEAVSLAREAQDPGALAHVLLAAHDVAWVPGSGATRLRLVAEMADAAEAAGDADLVAEASLLRAAALIEQGDPAGPAELARYTGLADLLGHARGRWSALSRRATLAELAGRVDEAVTLATEARALGEAIGLPDANGCYGTLIFSLAEIGGPPEPREDLMPAADPMWPVYPLLRAWNEVHVGDLAAAAASVHGFSVQTVPDKYDLEFVAITCTVFAAVGSETQRDLTYRRFAPFAGLHAVVGGCAAYHGVVDHYLGLLAAASGRSSEASTHFTAAIDLYERLGADAWAARSRDSLRHLDSGGDAFQLVDGTWRMRFEGREAQLPDAKGMHDIATLLGSPGRPVHVFTLLGRDAPATGSDPVLDRRAVAEFRSRLADLETEIAEAETWSDLHRASRARTERDALVAQLQSATGLGGRPRSLGSETERARKTISARVHDTLRRIERVHPPLADHLRAALRTGTSCSYLPDQQRHWHV
ncbi:ATP-binding protein [Kutzneria chonburiensis]|uniref:AAA family ATPase n=1 Tax=Kutzneria chonburiensis TaxID=1483604 RepID=A0ABV6MRR2_9PSEU|nr:AAA family ATPase [Kutzneria chonburiensis]